MDKRFQAYYDNTLNKADRIDLLKDVLTNHELKHQWHEYHKMQTLISLSSKTKDTRLGENGYLRFKQSLHIKKRRKYAFAVSRYAAIAAIFILLTWFSSSYFHKEYNLTAYQQVLNVPAGQRAQLTLPDGSKVWLNAGSKLTYPSIFKKERRVRLSGEGFFEVAKNANKPFIVSTHTIDIRAIGTKFNVFSYPNTKESTVYLQEGSVKVSFPNAKHKSIFLKPYELLTQQKNLFKTQFVGNDPLLWREGIYTFNKQPFSEILTKLQLYYDINILVKNPAILNYQYTGKFRQRDGVMEILRVIQHIHPFCIKYNRDLNQIILTK